MMLAKIEDAQFILDHGGSFAEAAQRVGWNPKTLQKNMKKAGAIAHEPASA
jgi:DNA-binding NtrC family response regulator